MSSNDQQVINLGMTKYDLIWNLTKAIVELNNGAKNVNDFYEKFLQCHALVNRADASRIDSPKVLQDILNSISITKAS